MTFEEFDNEKFDGRMIFRWMDGEYLLGEIAVGERLLGLSDGVNNHLYWVRCENAELVRRER